MREKEGEGEGEGEKERERERYVGRWDRKVKGLIEKGGREGERTSAASIVCLVHYLRPQRLDKGLGFRVEGLGMFRV